MRRAFLLVVLLSACSSDGTDATPTKPVAHRVPNLPRVDDDVVLSPTSAPQPAAFVWISPSGRLELAAVGPQWTGEPPTDRHVVIVPGEIHAEVLKAALASEGLVRTAAQAHMLGKGSAPTPDGTKRQTTAAIVRLAEADTVVPIIATAPTSPAVSIARVLVRAGGLVAVKHDKEAGVLEVGAQPGADHTSPTGMWAELHVDAQGIHVIMFPSGEVKEMPWRANTVDRDALKSYLATLATGIDLDVLIGEDVDAQRFVDLVVALHKLGAQRLFVGERPTGTIAQRIAQVNDTLLGTSSAVVDVYGMRANTPTVTMGQPNANGDLDKAIIRRYIRRNITKIQYCYEKALLGSPALAGTLQVQFFIDPEGKVASAAASGVDPEVANCVAEVIKTIEFPKPRGGGGVQVNYPFTFRAAGP